MHRLEVGKPDCLLRRLIYRLSERPAAAQTSVVDGPYIGFSVRPAGDVMTPEINACDAGVEAFDRHKPGAAYMSLAVIAPLKRVTVGKKPSSRLSPDMSRNKVCHICQWVSIRPGNRSDSDRRSPLRLAHLCLRQPQR